MSVSIRAAVVVLSFLGMAAVSSELFAQDPYRRPPAEIVELVDAPPPPSVNTSPDGTWMLLVERGSLPEIADLARPMLRLAGLRIDPSIDARYTTRFSSGLSVRPLRGGPTIRVTLPDDVRIGSVSWSHNSRDFAFTTIEEDGTALWIGKVGDPSEPKRIADKLNTIFGTMSWLPDGTSLLVRGVPEGRGEAPTPPRVPIGPTVQDSSGNKSPLRTYQDLLKSPHDEALFDHYATVQPYIVDVTGKKTKLGSPAIYSSMTASPNGDYFLVRRVERPYSYVQPYYGFPSVTEVWDRSGQRVHTVVETPMRENVPIGGVATGPRSIQWMANRFATLAWVEALDGGDPRREVAHRDEWKLHAAPFDSPAIPLFRVEHRARGLTYFENPNWVVASEYDRDRRWTRSQLYDLSTPDSPPVVLEDRDTQDIYGDPGRLDMKMTDQGRSVVRYDAPWVYRTGSGASPEGSLPFLDRQNLETLETERLWRCEKGVYERVVDIVSSTSEIVAEVITVRESPIDPPNYHLRRAAADDVVLTDFPHPQPQLKGIHKELVQYQRGDGVPLSATLYLPPNYEPGTRLPLLVWAYPREYNNAKTAGQVRTSPWRFTRIGGSSHLHLLTQGYAIMDGATIPIIGDPETMNDTFVEQLVASAKAAIDYADQRGVGDPKRVGVGGHSYGAFMTANLLAHCDLFQAGVARSGAYNRTLTPFGFQSERRSLWDAKSVYFGISPFMHANKINKPILLIHGEVDNNSGTFPMQSRRLFSAIKGNGGTARLVMLPHESHGYRARESILHTLAETLDWFDTHLKRGGVMPASSRQ
ncbi:MAG: prolyl oligopeptidase family serine peptidase [Planctomycetota bacterium]